GILDRQLAGKAYLTGDAFTYADLALGIFAGYRWFNFPIERPDCKNAKAWYDRLTQRPAFKEHVMIGIT
ncbi:MAG: glutathione S-transferase family protein, partial [Alphaproteobacteria bacterium]|nr:glutathione S-transferase family protein [Alphaproteobacteria bacterium]